MLGILLTGKNGNMYRYSILLLFAVMNNLISSILFPENFLMWYHIQHKFQGVCLIVGTFVYQKNTVNFLAGVCYLLIWIMNWILYLTGGFNTLSTASGILYIVALLFVLLKEKWKY